MSNDRVWRVLLGLGGVTLAIGGPLHPRGDGMHAMLIDPNWFPSHAAQLVGYILIGLGVSRFRRVMPHTPAVQRWSGLAAVALVLQAFEMAVHLASKLDADKLGAGLATPILSTHLALATVIYPLFAIAMIGLVVTGARHRELGNPWMVWLGVLGLVGHGFAGLLVAGFGIEWATIGFPMAMFFAIWALMVSLMPSRAPM